MIQSHARHRTSAVAPRSGPLGDREALWTYLAFEWAAGATLLMFVLTTTHSPLANRAALYAICMLACVSVAVMLASRSRLPEQLVQPALLLGHVLVSLVVYFSGDAMTFFAMFYVWLNVYAFYFFGLRSGWAHTALALSCYAIALVALPSPMAYTPWLMTAGTMIVVGSMVASLRGRVDRLVAELADAAWHDPLTGLLNRRGFGDAIAAEIERSRRTERPFSLLIADIDHFKRVNDQTGHHAGDDVLRRVGALLTTRKRQMDSAARLGGEEFAILVPEADAAGARAVAERLRRELRENFSRDVAPITMSIGIATFPHDAACSDDLMLAADKAMYRAKRLGRDRCEAFSPPHTPLTFVPRP
jgi:diguanylate cyclase (GGDEF)-like protein